MRVDTAACWRAGLLIRDIANEVGLECSLGRSFEISHHG